MSEKQPHTHHTSVSLQRWLGSAAAALALISALYGLYNRIEVRIAGIDNEIATLRAWQISRDRWIQEWKDRILELERQSRKRVSGSTIIPGSFAGARNLELERRFGRLEAQIEALRHVRRPFRNYSDQLRDTTIYYSKYHDLPGLDQSEP